MRGHDGRRGLWSSLYHICIFKTIYLFVVYNGIAAYDGSTERNTWDLYNLLEFSMAWDEQTELANRCVGLLGLDY